MAYVLKRGADGMRDWLLAGNAYECYFQDLEPDTWQGNVVYVANMPLVICACSRTVSGFRVYVLMATAAEELRHATTIDLLSASCSDD